MNVGMSEHLNTEHLNTEYLQTLACAAPYGRGGMGQHLAQLVEEARDAGRLERYFADAICPGDAAGQVTQAAWLPRLARYTPARFSPGWLAYFGGDLFDREAAQQLSRTENIRGSTPRRTFIGFSGQAEHCMRRARRLGYNWLELASATSHADHILRQHARVRQTHGIETAWMNQAQARKSRAEYALADTIQVSSEYARQSFLEAGIAETKLRRVHLQTSPRFTPPAAKPDDGVFRVVYVGSLTTVKGIPLLLEAFSRLTVQRAELTLVGGWATRGMRTYLQAWLARDARIRIAPGDPLPALQRADVCAHPSYDDGWGYAPMEALACGVPVIVTANTGMKERVQEGVNGYVVPVGDWQALLERLEQIHKHPLSMPVSPLSLKDS